MIMCNGVDLPKIAMGGDNLNIGGHMGGDLGGPGAVPQNLRWGMAHAFVHPIFAEVVLWDARESTK